MLATVALDAPEPTCPPMTTLVTGVTTVGARNPEGYDRPAAGALRVSRPRIPGMPTPASNSTSNLRETPSTPSCCTSAQNCGASSMVSSVTLSRFVILPMVSEYRATATELVGLVAPSGVAAALFVMPVCFTYDTTPPLTGTLGNSDSITLG